MRTLLFLLLVANTAYSQIKLDSSYAIGQPIVATCTTPLPPETQLHTIWETSDGLSSREFGQHLAIWVGKPGTYRVAVTTQITKELKLNGEIYHVLIPDSFKKYQVEFSVVGSTPTPPGPTPVPPNPSPIPSDKFDNIGQRVDSWIKETVPIEHQSKRVDLSNLYATLALNLKNGTFLTIGDSNEYFSKEKNKILTPQNVADAWAIAGSRIGSDLTGRKLGNRQDIIDYYQAVSTGMNPRK
jgi:hypothetical protein